MTDIISVSTRDFGGEQVQAVSARELFDFLGLTKNYGRWCKNNITESDFSIEGEDYILGGHLNDVSTDYILTVPFAKRICMMSKSPKGDDVRKYFVEIEKAYKAQKNKPLSQIEMIIQSAQILLDIEKKQKETEQRVLQLEAHSKTINTDYYTIAGYCHIKGKSVPITQASLLGRKCSKLSKDLDYEVSTTYDARYGTVNLYHLDILSQIIK